MKALTLTQPWATLVAIGAKRIETRSWATNYTGELAIHAAKGWTAADLALCATEPCKSALEEGGYLIDRPLPFGAVLAVANLKFCKRMGTKSPVPPWPEVEFGDYTVGRYLWVFSGVRQLILPVPATGRLGLWDWDVRS